MKLNDPDAKSSFVVMVKTPYPGELNTIETAVWAAEYVRVRATMINPHQASIRIIDNDDAITAANRAVDDLRGAAERLRSFG